MTPVTRCKRRAVTKSEMSLCRLTNPKSYLVHVDPHAPGIRASEYATRQFERTEWSRTDKSRVQFFVPRWISIVVQNELTMHLTYVSILRLIKPKTHAFYGVQRCPTMSNVVQRWSPVQIIQNAFSGIWRSKPDWCVVLSLTSFSKD